MRLGVLGLLLVAACGVEESVVLDPQNPDGGTRDTGPRRDAGPRDASSDDAQIPIEGVAVGIGEARFIPVATGDDVPLTAGPQGGGAFWGYHVWMSAWVDDSFDPQGAMVAIEVVPVGSTEILGNAGYQFDLNEDQRGGYSVWGMRAILRDCCLAQDHDIVMRVTVTDRNGKTGMDERTVRGAECFDPANPSYKACP